MNTLNQVYRKMRYALHNFRHRHDGESQAEREARRRELLLFSLSLYSAVLGTVAVILATIRLLQKVGIL